VVRNKPQEGNVYLRSLCKHTPLLLQLLTPPEQWAGKPSTEIKHRVELSISSHVIMYYI